MNVQRAFDLLQPIRSAHINKPVTEIQELQNSFKSSLGKLSSSLIVHLLFLMFTSTFKRRVSFCSPEAGEISWDVQSEMNFDAFTNSITAEQEESTLTWTVKWLFSVADELTFSGTLKICFVGEVCLNISISKQ